jgi:hypothetical protein
MHTEKRKTKAVSVFPFLNKMCCIKVRLILVKNTSLQRNIEFPPPPPKKSFKA